MVEYLPEAQGPELKPQYRKKKKKRKERKREREEKKRREGRRVHLTG
jgi:hypothetical protein